MKKIKILYGLEAAGGGALKHLVYLATRLSEKYFDITVILSNKRGENIDCEITKLINANIQVIIMPIKRQIHLSDVKVLCKLVSVMGKGKYDIVHAHSSKAGGLFRIAALLTNISNIYYTPHCFYFQSKAGLTKKFFIFLEKILGFATTGIIVSESEQKALIKHKIINPNKVLNINNAIDFDEYQHSTEIFEIKRKYGLTKESIVVGAIGRLTYQKDLETFIYAAFEVIKKIPETEFLIVGEGELYGEIKKLIFKLNLENKIFLTGYVQNVYEIYGIIDIYINTSLWEGLPYVFLEAMRYKKPIVATDTGNGSILVDKETGFITPVKDYKSIANQIIFLIENKALAKEMGQRGNTLLIEKYSFEKFIQEHERIYQKSTVGN